MAAGLTLRGKSGLHKATVPGNARPGQPEGKRHRKQTAQPSVALRWTWVRVKRWGKSPPEGWQQRSHGKPHREQCQIGAVRGAQVGQPIPPAGTL